MPMTPLAYEHLDCSNPERPLIAGKNFKVIHLVREHVAYGWSAEELALNHPQLTLGEVYAALAYYSDHREKLDQEISGTEKEAARMHAEPRHRVVSAIVRPRDKIVSTTSPRSFKAATNLRPLAREWP